MACAVLLLQAAAFASPANPEPGTADEQELAAEEAGLLREADLLEARVAEQGLLYGDPGLDIYLLRIADRLLLASSGGDSGAEAPVAIRARATSGITPLAVALPNGAIYVSVGLIACVDNEAQLAAVMAGEIARVMNRNDLRRVRDARARADKRFLPDLLLTTLSLGLTESSLSKRDREAQREYDRELDAEADRAGLSMLVRAGYAASEAPVAFQQLATRSPVIAPEPSTRFAEPARLESRRDVLSAGLATLPEAGRTSGEIGAEAVAGHRRDLLLVIARQQAGVRNMDVARALLDWRDAAFREDGPSAYLRADMARRTARSPEQQLEALDALTAATRFADVPVEAFRELGFAHRRRGEAELAGAAFREYLARSPDAVDAPIVRGYLESAE